MSKKKTKTKAAKQSIRHNLEHLSKNSVFIARNSSKNASSTLIDEKSRPVSPQDKFIKKDLKSSITTILIFTGLVILLSYLVYNTDLANQILSRWNIKY